MEKIEFGQPGFGAQLPENVSAYLWGSNRWWRNLAMNPLSSLLLMR